MFPHLFDLKEYKSRVGVTVAMELDQEVDSLSVATVGHEITWRLWQEEDGGNDNDTGKSLKDKRNSPLIIGIEEVGTIGDDGSGNRATEPTAVIETYYRLEL
jgi:hypothetical protein